jgi:phospholipase/carboxylesterase
MKTIQRAGLTVRLAGGSDREGGGDGPLVVLLHGFGAPGDDLVPLFRVLEAPHGTRWAFPAAPVVLSPTMGGSDDARAWWMIDIERRFSAAERGELETLAREHPPGLDEARAAVVGLIDALEEELRPSKLVIGGFSQGAMLSCDVALRSARPLAGIALLSGTLITADEWALLASGRPGLPAFQSHGMRDPLLPFAYAERLRDLLRAGGVEVTWVPFGGGHEIPERVLGELGRWLRSVLSG